MYETSVMSDLAARLKKRGLTPAPLLIPSKI
jgi:hypothetical protein